VGAALRGDSAADSDAGRGSRQKLTEYTSGDQRTDEAKETVLGTHYESMPLNDICGMPVKESD
jgi:hypothetical protein